MVGIEGGAIMSKDNGQKKGEAKEPKLLPGQHRMVDAETGRFVKGNRTGGRPFGSKDGIAEFRKLIAEVAGDMSVKGGDIDDFIKELRARGPQGAAWIIKNILFPMMKIDAGKTEVNIDGAASVQVNMFLQKPSEDQVKEIESRVVDRGEQ